MVNVESATALPGVSVAGTKEAVAPTGNPLADNVTGFANVPFCGVIAMVYVALPPGGTVCAPVGELTVKLGATVPVPFRIAVWGDPAALSATERVAV